MDPADPAFAFPSKPVGPSYDRGRAAEALRREKGWVLLEDAVCGYRRVVPSPEPLEIVEWPAIKVLVSAHVLVVAAGGGGIPVVRAEDGSLQGVEPDRRRGGAVPVHHHVRAAPVWKKDPVTRALLDAVVGSIAFRAPPSPAPHP